METKSFEDYKTHFANIQASYQENERKIRNLLPEAMAALYLYFERVKELRAAGICIKNTVFVEPAYYAALKKGNFITSTNLEEGDPEVVFLKCYESDIYHNDSREFVRVFSKESLPKGNDTCQTLKN